MFKYKNGRFFFKIRKDIFLIAAALLFLSWRPSILSSAALHITSYYPAPYGGYDRLFTTGETYLAKDGGSVYWGPSNSRLQTDQGGSIVLSGTSLYSMPSISFHITRQSADSVPDAKLSLKYLSRNPVLVSEGDFYVKGLRRACTVLPYKNSRSSTYCGGSRAASTKYIVIPQDSNMPIEGKMICCKFEIMS